MKDKGILLKPDMAKAADEGRKTQTRRIKKSDKCPYAVGQRLYLKETHYRHGYWVRNGKTKTGKRAWCFVGSTKPEEWLFEPPDFARVEQDSYHTIGWYKRSKLFMPKRFARRWFVVTAVRAERLQDISDADAIAEGLPTIECDATAGYVNGKPVKMFACLWESIHGPGSWEMNPWNWVVTFEKE